MKRPLSLGKYQSLYVYLHGRFANRVVLTFVEIEDLMGSSLPDAARREREWWGLAETAASASEQSDAWTLANRRAEVNLSAQRVVFDRDEALGARPRHE